MVGGHGTTNLGEPVLVGDRAVGPEHRSDGFGGLARAACRALACPVDRVVTYMIKYSQW